MTTRRKAQSLEQLRLTESAERRIISTICDWERIEYGEGKHRTPEELHECARKNRSGFFILTDASSLLGYADVWELDRDFYRGLRGGAIAEESLAKQYILGRSDAQSGLWYIGSIITEPALRRDRPVRAALAFAAICNVLPYFFRNHTPFPSKVLGVGSSTFGKKLLTRWGFEPVVRDERAIDLRPRFEKSMTKPQDADSLYLGRHEI